MTMKAAPLSKKQEKSLCLLIVVSFVALFLYVKGCQKAMHFTLDGQAVFVYAPDTKDDLI